MTKVEIAKALNFMWIDAAACVRYLYTLMKVCNVYLRRGRNDTGVYNTFNILRLLTHLRISGRLSDV